MSIKVKFDTSELVAGLTKLAMLADPTISKVVQKNGAELQKKEMRDVPVDTGFLKRSIMLSSEDYGLTSVVEPTANYSNFVEYGTRFMAAQPYVRPNYYEQVKQFMKEMEKLVK